MTRILQAFAVSFLLLFALLVGTAQSCPCYKDGKGPDQGPMTQLTAEQQKTAQEISDKYQAPREKINDKLRAAQADMRATMTAETFDAAKARELNKEISALHSEAMEMQMAQCIEMREKGIADCANCRCGSCRAGTHRKGCGLKRDGYHQGKPPCRQAPCPSPCPKTP